MERNKIRITELIRKQTELLKKIIFFLIDFYSLFISPLVPTGCRYNPTCSAYMRESIEKKGVLRGLLFGIKRILRCNPFFSGGYDPVK
ncbi:MAG: membrane protein insertion efficiency factor YidD [Syntrophorhabdaceae bacterium]|nr:membrane protein insertion efficiency factor YidD [Syntrophorhabdales bacterium]MBP9560285.1 membrane protein insertion efficiency factor YidD [Syntrophorhabdaceae bacterium]